MPISMSEPREAVRSVSRRPPFMRGRGTGRERRCLARRTVDRGSDRQKSTGKSQAGQEFGFLEPNVPRPTVTDPDIRPKPTNRPADAPQERCVPAFLAHLTVRCRIGRRYFIGIFEAWAQGPLSVLGLLTLSELSPGCPQIPRREAKANVGRRCHRRESGRRRPGDRPCRSLRRARAGRGAGPPRPTVPDL